jgi:hypothetical protein
MYRLEDIRHETRSFWVLDVGTRGFEVYRKGPTASTRVASIGNGPALGLTRAIAECERRQTLADQEHDAQVRAQWDKTDTSTRKEIP